MKTILIILGSETGQYAKGMFNKSLFEEAKKYLSQSFNVITTVIENGYTAEKEVQKWKQSNFIIYQYPVYWFMMPSILKKYIDTVYQYGEFYTGAEEYGSGGLMKDKEIMLSTTWNSPLNAFKGNFYGKDVDRDTMLLPMRKTQTYCGMKELPHFSCHNIIINPNFEENKKNFIKHLDKIFSSKV